jgi:hypothetical protein
MPLKPLALPAPLTDKEIEEAMQQFSAEAASAAPPEKAPGTAGGSADQLPMYKKPAAEPPAEEPLKPADVK